MRQGMIICNQVQTDVISEGRWIEEDPLSHSSKHIVLVVPGNPGIPLFYEGFIKELKSRLTSDIPVWVIGHAGHVEPSKDLDIAMPSDEKWTECYSLVAQIQHKVEFIKKYIPEDAHLHLIGHSIGAWMVLNLLKNNDIEKRIQRCYLLFPALEYLAETPKGTFFNNFITPLEPLWIFLSWMFTTMFPITLQTFIIHIFNMFYGISINLDQAFRDMLNPDSARRVNNLCREMLKYVREADHETVSKHIDKLWFYYGASDGWVPLKYYKNMMLKHPNLNAQLCQRSLQHTFVLKDYVDMGHIVGNLINEDLKH